MYGTLNAGVWTQHIRFLFRNVGKKDGIITMSYSAFMHQTVPVNLLHECLTMYFIFLHWKKQKLTTVTCTQRCVCYLMFTVKCLCRNIVCNAFDFLHLILTFWLVPVSQPAQHQGHETHFFILLFTPVLSQQGQVTISEKKMKILVGMLVNKCTKSQALPCKWYFATWKSLEKSLSVCDLQLPEVWCACQKN